MSEVALYHADAPRTNYYTVRTFLVLTKILFGHTSYSLQYYYSVTAIHNSTRSSGLCPYIRPAVGLYGSFTNELSGPRSARPGQTCLGMTLEPFLWLHCSISGRCLLGFTYRLFTNGLFITVLGAAATGDGGERQTRRVPQPRG